MGKIIKDTTCTGNLKQAKGLISHKMTVQFRCRQRNNLPPVCGFILLQSMMRRRHASINT